VNYLELHLFKYLREPLAEPFFQLFLNEQLSNNASINTKHETVDEHALPHYISYIRGTLAEIFSSIQRGRAV
jgi:hypothetical protein